MQKSFDLAESHFVENLGLLELRFGQTLRALELTRDELGSL